MGLRGFGEDPKPKPEGLALEKRENNGGKEQEAKKAEQEEFITGWQSSSSILHT